MPRSKPPRRKPAGPRAGQGHDPLARYEMDLELAEDRMELVGRLLHLAEDALGTASLEEIEEVRTSAVRRILGGSSSQREFHKDGSVLRGRHRVFDYPVLSRLAFLKDLSLILTGQDCWQLYAAAPQDMLDTMPEHEGFFRLLLAEEIGDIEIAQAIKARWAFA